MNITVKNIFPVKEKKGSTLAFASVSFTDGKDSVLLPGIPIFARKDGKGLFAKMPETKGKDGKFHPVAYVSGSLRKKAVGAVINEYKKKKN